MSEDARIGHGIQFLRGDGATPEVFSAIPGLCVPNEPGLSRDMVEATDTDSADRYKEFIAGLNMADDLELEFERLLGNASQTLLYTDMHNRARKNYKIVWPDEASTTWAFSGHISKIAPSAPLAGKAIIKTTFKISGKPTLT